MFDFYMPKGFYGKAKGSGSNIPPYGLKAPPCPSMSVWKDIFDKKIAPYCYGASVGKGACYALGFLATGGLIFPTVGTIVDFLRCSTVFFQVVISSIFRYGEPIPYP